MAVQLSTTTRNRLRDAYVAAFPAGSILELRTGGLAGVGNADTGTLIASITLPASPFTNGTGQVTLNGTWSDTSANNTGTIAHYRITNGADIEEGTVTTTGGGGDMEVDSTSVTAGQVVSITAWTITMPGA